MKTEKKIENVGHEEPKGMFGDILEDLKTHWWKYLLSFATGAGSAFGGLKLMEKAFTNEPDENLDEDISEAEEAPATEE